MNDRSLPHISVSWAYKCPHVYQLIEGGNDAVRANSKKAQEASECELRWGELSHRNLASAYSSVIWNPYYGCVKGCECREILALRLLSSLLNCLLVTQAA